MITQAINLNLIPGQVLPRVNVSQYDSGTRTLQMTLFNGEQIFNVPSGASGFIQGTKPDRTGFQYAATVTAGSNIVTIDITQQMTAVKGEVVCELVLANDDDRIATVNFIIYVEPAALADDTIISDTELPLIEEAAELAQRIDGITQQINEDAQTASNAATTASNAAIAAQRASEAATTAQDAAEESADKAEAYGTHPPYIGANGNWFVYNVTTQQYEDSGVKAQGPLSGLTDVEISNPAENDIIAYDPTAQKWKNSSEFQTLTNQVKDMNNVLGAKNLLPNNAVTQVKRGITFTVNDDGSVRLTGTATGEALFDLPVDLTDGVTYTASGISGGSDTTYQVFLQNATGGASNAGYFVNGEKTFTKNSGQSAPNNYDVHIYRIRVLSGTTVDTVIYPMIRLASITDDTYVPYAKTNKELTEDIDTVNSQISDLTTTSDITSSVTFPNASLICGGVFRNGNICTIKCNIQISAEIGNNEVLIANIPKVLMKSALSSFVKLCPVRASTWSVTSTKWHLQSLFNSTYITNATQTLNVGDVVDLDWTYIIDE